MTYKRCITFLYFIFPFLVVTSYTLLFIEAFSYRGIVRKILLFDSSIWLGVTVLVGFLSQILRSRDNSVIQGSLYTLVLKMNLLLLPVVLVITYVFSTLELNHYPNYVYSTFHINPQNLKQAINFGISLVIIQLIPSILENFKVEPSLKFFIKSVKKRNHWLIIRQVSAVLAIYLLVTYAVNSFVATLNSSMLGSWYILSNYNASYDDKMRVVWGDFYTYMSMVKELTPENAIIIHPPQKNPWQLEGNQFIDRYFLYPRTLVSAKNLSKVRKEETGVYIMLAWGNSSYPPADGDSFGWPNFDIKATRVLFFDLKTRQIQTIEGPYKYTDPINKNAWGLIEL